MNYADIKKIDVANGEGVRVSLFVSGCNHHCKGCFNQCAWDFNYGNKFTEKEEQKIIEYMDHDYIEGLSLGAILVLILKKMLWERWQKIVKQHENY